MSTTTPSPLKAAPRRALGADTLCAAFQRTAAERPDEVALRMPGDPKGITWHEYADRVRRLAAGLSSLGLRRGDTLALLLTNRVEFHLLDAAAIHLGAVPFSIYTTSSPEQIEFLLRDSGARIAVTEEALLGRLEKALQSKPTLDHLLMVDGLAELERPTSPGFDFEAAWRAVRPDDLLTLIYTSGTTGPPKGVELTHRNLLSAWRGMHAMWSGPRPGGSTISYLPSAHVADRFASHYAAMLFGISVTCCPDPRQVGGLLPETRPTLFVSVPRIWQKLRAAVEPAVPAWALDTGRRAVALEQRGEPLPEDLRAERERAERLVFGGIRERIGLDRCEVAVCAAAPVPREVLEFFHAIGLPILEVYGLSETCAVATANPRERPRIGTVGRPIPGVELRLAGDGEVLLRSESLMRGYRNRPDKTVEAIDGEGWLRTGDVGVLDAEGYLRIVDRKKELIVNAAGKNMSPANIETALKAASPLIGNACVIGDARPYNVALLTADAEAAAAFTAEHGEDALRAEVAAAVERANARLSRVEQAKRHVLLDKDWTPGGAELTPTMKLRRRAIEARFCKEIEELYARQDT
jgi:long-chain acyl-CoA synthetase